MTEIAAEASVLLSDPRIVDTVIDATMAADLQLYGCVSMLCRVSWENAPSEARELATFVFSEAAARPSLGEDLAHAVALASYNLSRPWFFPGLGDGIASALASRLSSTARLRMLTITSEMERSGDFGSNLAWSLAAWCRQDPSVIQDAPGLTLRVIAVLIDSLARTLPVSEFAGLGHQVLDSLRLVDAHSVAAMVAEDPTRWQPRTRQLAVSWSTGTSPSGLRTELK